MKKECGGEYRYAKGTLFLRSLLNLYEGIHNFVFNPTYNVAPNARLEMELAITY